LHINMIGIGVNILGQLTRVRYPAALRAYWQRVRDTANFTMGDFNTGVSIWRKLQQLDLVDSLELMFYSEGGNNIRTDGLLKFYVKSLDVSGNENDLDGSATAANQPRQVSGIAPVSRVAAGIQAGETTRKFTHPNIVVSGTYTIVKVLNDETEGKAEVTYEEVTTGTLSEVVWTGNLYFYAIFSSEIVTANRNAMTTFLQGVYPEIESVTIGTQEWSIRNFEAVATPEGNVIANITENGAVEKIVNGGFDTDTAWGKGSGWAINTGKAINTNSIAGSLLLQTSVFTSNKWYKITFDCIITNGTYSCGSAITGNVFTGKSPNFSSSGIKEFIIKANVSTFNICPQVPGANAEFDNVSVQELNWSNATEIYDAVYASTAGTADEKEYAALKEASMWAYNDNSVNNGAIYGKILNGYARKLFKLDMATASFGYHIGTDAEYQLIDDSAYDLMMEGTDYWTTDNGTNETGLTVLGGGYRLADGTFAAVKGSTRLWIGDADKTVQLTDNSDTVTIAAESLLIGAYLRILKD